MLQKFIDLVTILVKNSAIFQHLWRSLGNLGEHLFFLRALNIALQQNAAYSFRFFHVRLLVNNVDMSDEIQDICYTMFKEGVKAGSYARITDIKK